MKKVLWFSRHEMSPEQKAALGKDVEINQINKTIQSARELENEIKEADVVAIVAPIDLQQQFLRLAEDRPVIMAVNDRVIVPDKDSGEDKVEFHFNKWEQLKGIEIEKSDYVPDADKKKVLWFSRHEMSPEQMAALGEDVELNQVNKTIQSARELENEIKEADVVAIVAPINLQQQFLRLAEDRPVIMAVNDRVIVPDKDGGEDKVEFHFNKWEQLKGIEIEKSDYAPEQPLRQAVKDAAMKDLASGDLDIAIRGAKAVHDIQNSYDQKDEHQQEKEPKGIDIGDNMD